MLIYNGKTFKKKVTLQKSNKMDQTQLNFPPWNAMVHLGMVEQ